MHAVFVAVKQECGKLLFGWLGVTDAPIKPEELVDLAIQRGQRSKPA